MAATIADASPSRHIGGGHKQRYRFIDFKRNKLGIAAKVESIEYDPMRTARIALLKYTDGEQRYILAPVGLEVGSSLASGPAGRAERSATRSRWRIFRSALPFTISRSSPDAAPRSAAPRAAARP